MSGAPPFALGCREVLLGRQRRFETEQIWQYRSVLGTWVGPRKFEHRNGADSGGLARILGKAWITPRLLGVDAVAFSAGQFADGHLVCLGSAFDTAIIGGQVVVPVRVGGY